MPSGELYCPKCHNPGMCNYLYYESKILNDGRYHWIFYNTEERSGTWKCWALMEVCGCTPRHWYDPCGCCFNPCAHTTEVVTYVDGVEVKREKDLASGIVCCFLFFLVCYLIYIMYFTIFFWYDIYYYCCKSRKTMRDICTGNGHTLVPEDSNYWADHIGNFYTEKYWCNNFPGLFMCTECNYRANSFKDFMDVNQTSNSVNIATTQNDTNLLE